MENLTFDFATYVKAKNLKEEAHKDNIDVHLLKTGGSLYYRIGKATYSTYQGALNHVHFLQAQIAPSVEVRS